MLRARAALGAALLLAAAAAAANPGAPIPPPALSIGEAAARASAALAAGEGPADPRDRARAGEFLVLGARYERDGAGWGWTVTLIHPVANDRSYVFRLAGDAPARLTGATE